MKRNICKRNQNLSNRWREPRIDMGSEAAKFSAM